MTKKNTIFDLSEVDTSIASDEGREMQLENRYVDEDHPDYGEVINNGGAPVTISLLGTDGNKFQKIYQRQMHKIRESKRSKKDNDLNESEKSELAFNLYAELTVAWSGIVENGKELTCNFKNAKKLYQTFPWIFEQVVEFVGRREAFLPKKRQN